MNVVFSLARRFSVAPTHHTLIFLPFQDEIQIAEIGDWKITKNHSWCTYTKADEMATREKKKNWLESFVIRIHFSSFSSLQFIDYQFVSQKILSSIQHRYFPFSCNLTASWRRNFSQYFITRTIDGKNCLHHSNGSFYFMLYVIADAGNKIITIHDEYFPIFHFPTMRERKTFFSTFFLASFFLQHAERKLGIRRRPDISSRPIVCAKLTLSRFLFIRFDGSSLFCYGLSTIIIYFITIVFHNVYHPHRMSFMPTPAKIVHIFFIHSFTHDAFEYAWIYWTPHTKKSM